MLTNDVARFIPFDFHAWFQFGPDAAKEIGESGPFVRDRRNNRPAQIQKDAQPGRIDTSGTAA